MHKKTGIFTLLLLVFFTSFVFASDNLKQLTDLSFKKDIIDSKGYVLVDFSAPWCSWCVKQHPELARFADMAAEKIKVYELNTDNNPAAPNRYKVRSYPTMILFKDGREIKRFSGYRPAERLQSELEEYLK